MKVLLEQCISIYVCDLDIEIDFENSLNSGFQYFKIIFVKHNPI